jgi:hypothetical protein
VKRWTNASLVGDLTPAAVDDQRVPPAEKFRRQIEAG